MRIATWNVNSLKARLEKVEWWLERAAPDILLIQETKLTDADAPVMAFAMAGYQLVHHGEGRWNGVAIAARDGLAISDVVTNFGDGPVRDSGPGGAGADVASEDDFDPFDEARMVAATVDGLRVVSLYAPNGRIVGSPFYAGKLAWYERLGRWIRDNAAPGDALVIGGDFNVAPTDADVGRGRRPRRHARVRARTRGLSWPPRPRADRRLPGAPFRARPLHVVGLPGRHVPQELRDAHRPPAGVGAGRGAGRGRRDRPRGAQGAAGAVRPRPAPHRPRRAGTPVRPGLGRRARPHRREDEAQALTMDASTTPILEIRYAGCAMSTTRAGLGGALFGVPLALAAFISGLAVTESNDAAEARRRLRPFRDVFAVLFFVAIGTLVDAIDAILFTAIIPSVAVSVAVSSIAVRLVPVPKPPPAPFGPAAGVRAG